MKSDRRWSVGDTLAGVPLGLLALTRALKLTERAVRVGFEMGAHWQAAQEAARR